MVAIMDRVEVIWRDASGPTDEWQHIDTVETSTDYVTTIGYIIKDTPMWLVLGQSYDVNNMLRGVFEIPKSNIENISILKPTT